MACSTAPKNPNNPKNPNGTKPVHFSDLSGFSAVIVRRDHLHLSENPIILTDPCCERFWGVEADGWFDLCRASPTFFKNSLMSHHLFRRLCAIVAEQVNTS